MTDTRQAGGAAPIETATPKDVMTRLQISHSIAEVHRPGLPVLAWR